MTAQESPEDGSKSAPRAPQLASKRVPHGPRRSKSDQRHPIWLPNGPKRPQEASKVRPKRVPIRKSWRISF
eukprot:2825436-Pyramimonas_sp.AAC.1